MMTVFWYNADIDITDTQSKDGLETGFTRDGVIWVKPKKNVNLNGSTSVVPNGVDVKAPQISNFFLGLVQNVSSSTLVYYTDPHVLISPPAGDQLGQVHSEMKRIYSDFQGALDVVSKPDFTQKYKGPLIWGHNTELAFTDGKFTENQPAEYRAYDKPSPACVFPDSASLTNGVKLTPSKQTLTVYYNWNRFEINEQFIVWVGIMDNIKELIPIKQRGWSMQGVKFFKDNKLEGGTNTDQSVSEPTKNPNLAGDIANKIANEQFQNSIDNFPPKENKSSPMVVPTIQIPNN